MLIPPRQHESLHQFNLPYSPYSFFSKNCLPASQRCSKQWRLVNRSRLFPMHAWKEHQNYIFLWVIFFPFFSPLFCVYEGGGEVVFNSLDSITFLFCIWLPFLFWLPGESSWMGLPGGRKNFKSEFQQNLSLKISYHCVFEYFVYRVRHKTLWETIHFFQCMHCSHKHVPTLFPSALFYPSVIISSCLLMQQTE